MADPTVFDITKNTPTKIATAVKTGIISKHWRDKRDIYYYSTYRATGEAAPTLEEMDLEMVRMFQINAEQQDISNTTEIDVYILAAREDGTAEQGKLVVAV